MIDASPAASRIDPSRIGFFGFSRGGYTGLVLVGGNPDLRPRLPTYASNPRAISTTRSAGRSSPRSRSPMTRASRLPSSSTRLPCCFTADSLQAIKVPIQLWASELGGDGVTPHMVAAVDSGLRVKHQYHVVPKAGHFAFLAPCPPPSAKARRRALHGCAGLRPRRLPPAVRCGCAGVFPCAVRRSIKSCSSADAARCWAGEFKCTIERDKSCANLDSYRTTENADGNDRGCRRDCGNL